MQSNPAQLYQYPVGDPRFRYRPSKNPYWAKLKERSGQTVFLDHDAELADGRWRERAPDQREWIAQNPGRTRRPLWVEIGCNGAHVLRGLAARDSDPLFVGIDWKFKQVFLADEKARKAGLQNALFVRGRGERLDQMFAEGEVDRLCIFFPDPWRKKSQRNNRFIVPSFLKQVHRLLGENGVVHIKTDHADYFEWICEAFRETAHLWEVEVLTGDKHAEHPNPTSLQIPDVTLFEALFIKDGLPIHELIVRKI